MIAHTHIFKEPIAVKAHLQYKNTTELVYVFKRLETDKGYIFYFCHVDGMKCICRKVGSECFVDDTYNRNREVVGQLSFDLRGVGL